MKRYKRMPPGLSPAQGELNSAIQNLLRHEPDAHAIHDDMVLATTTHEEHKALLKRILILFEENGVTLNPSKSEVGVPEIRFWGLLVNEDGVRPDPRKVEALDHISPPTSKEDLTLHDAVQCRVHPNVRKESRSSERTHKGESEIQMGKKTSRVLPRNASCFQKRCSATLL